MSMFELASRYADRGMTAYAELQDDEFAARERGYRATEHQAFAGTEFFDAVSQVISGGTSSPLALTGPREREQNPDATPAVIVSTPSSIRWKLETTTLLRTASSAPVPSV